MRPEIESFWRELLKQAGPSSVVPAVDVQQCGKSFGIAPTAIEQLIRELMDCGAVARLTGEELRKIARRQKLNGDFVRWESTSGTQFFRVEDPDDLCIAILAGLEILRREDAELAQNNPLLNSRIRWLQFWTASPETIQAQAEAFWNARCASPNVDPALTPNIGEKYLEYAFQTAFNGEGPAKVEERRTQIASEIKRLSDKLPGWSRQSLAVEFRREQIPKAIQQEVWRRDQGRCVECGSKGKLEFDHIIPVSKGGATTTRNLQLLCEPCNRSKNNRI